MKRKLISSHLETRSPFPCEKGRTMHTCHCRLIYLYIHVHLPVCTHTGFVAWHPGVLKQPPKQRLTTIVVSCLASHKTCHNSKSNLSSILLIVRAAAGARDERERKRMEDASAEASSQGQRQRERHERKMTRGSECQRQFKRLTWSLAILLIKSSLYQQGYGPSTLPLRLRT